MYTTINCERFTYLVLTADKWFRGFPSNRSLQNKCMVKDEVGVASPDSGKKITGQTPLLVYFLVNTKTNGNLKKENNPPCGTGTQHIDYTLQLHCGTTEMTVAKLKWFYCKFPWFWDKKQVKWVQVTSVTGEICFPLEVIWSLVCLKQTELVWVWHSTSKPLPTGLSLSLASPQGRFNYSISNKWLHNVSVSF